MFAKKIILIALLAVSAHAQGTSSRPNDTPTTTSSGSLPSQSVSTCVLDCATSSTLCTFTDASCVCTNAAYQTAVAQCLQTSCTPAEIAQAQALQAALCGSSSVLSSITSSLSSELSSLQSSASSRISSISSVVNSKSSTGTTPTPTGTNTATGGSGGASGLTASFLATGGALLLGVIGGGLLVF